jgi:Protein of unknown function (DUF4446)
LVCRSVVRSPTAKDTIRHRPRPVRPRAGAPARLGNTPFRRTHPIDLALADARFDLVSLGLAVLLVVALVAVVILARRTRGLERRISSLTRDGDGRSLEGLLEAHLDKVVALDREVDQLSTRTGVLEVAGRRAFQRLGLVRYNPFEETGGNQSFALALLDADDDGFIVSSLHARSGTRVYAKALTAGRSEGALSAEEAEALALARGATKGRPAIADHAGAGAARSG